MTVGDREFTPEFGYSSMSQKRSHQLGSVFGEITKKNRLITPTGKKNWRHSGFTPIHNRSYSRHGNYGGYGISGAYEDFQSQDGVKSRVVSS
jgi:hypothetical protein